MRCAARAATPQKSATSSSSGACTRQARIAALVRAQRRPRARGDA
jgi:hypothetical protein